VRRGEVWWVEFPAPINRRPALLLSRNEAYDIRTAATVAVISSTIRNNRTEIRLTKEDGMQRDCAINLDEIHTVFKGKIHSKITTLSEEKMRAVSNAAIYALDLD